MRIYQGRRDPGEAVVMVDGRVLDPRLYLRNHSPTGFEWGYAGSGPAQLALAILADHFGDSTNALALYQDFKFAVIAGLPREGWKLTAHEISQAVQKIRNSTRPETTGNVPGVNAIIWKCCELGWSDAMRNGHYIGWSVAKQCRVRRKGSEIEQHLTGWYLFNDNTNEMHGPFRTPADAQRACPHITTAQSPNGERN